MSTKWVYFFGNGQTDGQQGNRNLVGGKGASLAEMVSLNIPVPVSCYYDQRTTFHANNEQWPEGGKSGSKRIWS